MEEALDKGVEPERIAFLSFTRKAAQEAVDRACLKFNLIKKDFHTLEHYILLLFVGLDEMQMML